MSDDSQDEWRPIFARVVSDVGYWRHWLTNPKFFQIEFGGAQLCWQPPSNECNPPDSIVALRVYEPRFTIFVTNEPSLPPDWSEALQNDRIDPFTLEFGQFRFDDVRFANAVLGKGARTVLLGAAPSRDEDFAGFELLAFTAHQVGLVVSGSRILPANRFGHLDAEALRKANSSWWDYWRNYWQRRNSPNPMPHDYACEVTIPENEFHFQR